MHISITLDDDIDLQLKALDSVRGETRSDLIRTALKDWLARQAEASTWPAEIMAFEGMPDMPPFESYRQTLAPPAEDPLA